VRFNFNGRDFFVRSGADRAWGDLNGVEILVANRVAAGQFSVADLSMTGPENRGHMAVRRGKRPLKKYKKSGRCLKFTGKREIS